MSEEETVPVKAESSKRIKREVNGKPVLSVSALLAGDEASAKLLADALASEGPEYMVPHAYVLLQRHLGYGSAGSDGVPDLNSLTWLALKTQMFTAAE